MIFLAKSVLHLVPKSSRIPCFRFLLNTCRIRIISTNLVSQSVFPTPNTPCRSFSSVKPPKENNDEKTCKPTFCERLVKSSGPMEPYLRLIRLHNPTGCWLLFWPFGWSIALATNPGHLPDISYLVMFCSMAFLMRGAGCTINDMWDKEIDQKVARTKDRPLAKNKMTRFDALVFLGGQLGIGCLILLQYNFYTVILSASSLGLAVSYPLMKKLIPWPQLILGMAMNFGSLVGSSAIHGFCDWSVCLPLYLGGICWTIVYDTIYAFQDLSDDKKLGLKSTAISFGEYPRLCLSGFATGMISFLSLCGYMNGQTWPYYLSLLVVSGHLTQQISYLDKSNAAECAKKFASNQRVGLILFLGIVFGNLLKSKSTNNVNSSSSQQFVTNE